ncbi:MAG TPA: HAD family hydrolase [Patescibacteria group bacterium]
MSEAIIAIVCDFDETLGPDTISFLLEQNKIPYNKFWPDVYARVKDGWDPPLAYMQLLLSLAKQSKLDLSPQTLKLLGAKLPLFPGLPAALDELQTFVKTESRLKNIALKLEFYIISGGLEEIILGTGIASRVTGLFASSFAYGQKTKEPLGIKTAISFTEKTRYLFGINKGVSVADLRSDPYKINKVISAKDRRIPFPQMIYIGDGPSDIPCLSTISQYGGVGIGVSAPHESFKRGYELARGRRITVGPYTANYQPRSDIRKVLEETILRIGLSIDLHKKETKVS